MRNILVVLVFVLAAGQAWGADPAAAADGSLKVMTFNLRYASPNPPNSWPQRRPVTKECIRAMAPDLIGTQEGVYQQLKDIGADLPEYEWMGVGRDGGSRGEFMAIFFRKDRFEPLEYDYYWLSDTPNVVGSTTWGNTNRRMVWQIRFLDKQTNQQFWHINTHLDHAIQTAREKAAEAIIQRSQKLLAGSLPVIFTADFNATRSNKVYSMLVNDAAFSDTWYAAAKRFNEQTSSMNNFQPAQMNGQRIDWILSRGPVVVDEEGVVTFSKDGQNPSDHFPVMAKLRIDRTATTRPTGPT